MEEMRKLTYETYLTGKASSSDELPMIIPLHFMGSNPNQIFDVLLNGFNCSTRVIAPYEQYKHAEQYSWFPDSLYDENERDQGRFIDEITGLLLENVESWTQEFPTRGIPIYLGVSQGGDMCFTLASRYGNRFRLCLPIAGRLLVEEIIQKRNTGAVRIHHTEKSTSLPTMETLTDDQFALHVLVDFLENLHAGNYDDAVQFYGGTYETMTDHNPSIDPNNLSTLLRNACTINGAQCLQVKSAGLDKKVSDTEFIFKVDFLNEDGTLFVRGPCCGGNETDFPPQSVFIFTVMKVDKDKFIVMNMPPYTP